MTGERYVQERHWRMNKDMAWPGELGIQGCGWLRFWVLKASKGAARGAGLLR